MKRNHNSEHHHDRAQDLERRQQELEQREQLLRLKELENELYEQNKTEEPPLYPTRKENPPLSKLKRWRRKLVLTTKFIGFAIVTLITVKIAYSLAIMIMLGGLGWLGYQMFIAKDVAD